jgi:hypothetical protein
MPNFIVFRQYRSISFDAEVPAYGVSRQISDKEYYLAEFEEMIQ